MEQSLRELKKLYGHRGPLRFNSSRAVTINNEILEADKIFINVGGRAAVPSLTGIRVVFRSTIEGCIDSTEAGLRAANNRAQPLNLASVRQNWITHGPHVECPAAAKGLLGRECLDH